MNIINDFEQFINNKEIEMKSNELNDLLNGWRVNENKRPKAHKEFMRDIRKEMKALESVGIEVGGFFPPTKYKDEQGKDRDCYLLNKTSILQMATKESAYVRAKVIEYINILETYIEESGQSEEFKYYRQTGKIIRRGLTDTIQKVYGNSDKFIYAKYTNLVYNVVFNKTANELKLEKGLKKSQKLRDNFTSDELDEILEVENKLKSLIETYEMEDVRLDMIFDRAKSTILRVYHIMAI